MLKYLTAGESHGKELLTIIHGLPMGIPITEEDIDHDLTRRQKGFGRGGRMHIEVDHAEIVAGVRHGKTIGSPVAIKIRNRDWEKWMIPMSIGPVASKEDLHQVSSKNVLYPRPGHADLAGIQKYGLNDARSILERSSARETAARCAAGACARRMLNELSIQVTSHVVQIGPVSIRPTTRSFIEIARRAERSPMRMVDPRATEKSIRNISRIQKIGDTVGGVFEVICNHVPPGLGSHTHWDDKLDARLARAVMSIQAIKGVEIGAGFSMAMLLGSEVHDEIYYCRRHHRYYRRTNRAGGIEGGISNGEPIVIRAVMKPIPTLRKPLHTVNIITKKPGRAVTERSDVCAVPAAAVVGEAVVSIEIANSVLSKFGGDSMREMKRNISSYLQQLRAS